MADRVRISKALSYLLRHNAIKQGLSIDEEGYVPVSTILSVPQLKGVSFATVQEIVNDDPKRRFNLVKTDQDWMIRCNQGHSIKIDIEMSPLTTLPEDCFHGTFFKSLEKIREEGLRKMSRNHIHLTDDRKMLRKNIQALVFINLELAIQEGINFYRSDNGVILTAGIDGVLPPKYFIKITDNKGNVI